MNRTPAPRRGALNRPVVQRAAIAYADTHGIAALNMRSLASELGVVPMALYKHVASKEALLDAMVEGIVDDITQTPETGEWKADVRRRILSARQSLRVHPWARDVLESSPAMTPAMLAYLDGVAGLFLRGLSAELTHQLMHALGNRMWGFNPQLFAATPASDAETFNAQRAALPSSHPHLAQIARVAVHADPESGLLPGCDDQAEFEFTLDLILDAVDALQREGSRSSRLP